MVGHQQTGQHLEWQIGLHKWQTNVPILGIYDDILFLFNLEFFLYDHDQIFKTRIYLDILDGFDMIQQQKQDIVQG